MGLFESNEDEYVKIQPTEVLKEGFLSKKSKILKKWRSRWTVVTNTHIYTFEKPRDYRKPTEVLNLAADGHYALGISLHDYGVQICIDLRLKNGESF